MSEEGRTNGQTDLRRTAAQLGLAVVFVAVTAAVALTARLWPLLFGAVLLAVLLRACSDWLARRIRPRSAGLAYALVCALAAAATAATLWLVAPHAAAQMDELATRWSGVLGDLRERIHGLPGGRRMLSDLRDSGLGELTQSLGRAASLSATTAMSLVVVVVIAIYLGASPGLYLGGLIRLIPPRHRPRASEVLRAMGHTLRRFLVGRVVSMLAVGLLTGVGLSLMGVPLAAMLGILAGLLTFVPYAGPITASLPILVVAAVEGAMTLLMAVGYYTLVQCIEGFLITPMVQRKAVQLPPAVTLAAQIFMGILFGVAGVVISTPFAAAALVFVRRVYVHDVLGDRS
ncbi:AI-2E family transporter [Sorangium sp. So ce1036]|uniref:AI-2E family transporter n=1 Tax=Sorangium sp. So ce1036 TaxID=3133328 RepID=UPI003F0923BF